MGQCKSQLLPTKMESLRQICKVWLEVFREQPRKPGFQGLKSGQGSETLFKPPFPLGLLFILNTRWQVKNTGSLAVVKHRESSIAFGDSWDWQEQIVRVWVPKAIRREGKLSEVIPTLFCFFLSSMFCLFVCFLCFPQFLNWTGQEAKKQT